MVKVDQHRIAQQYSQMDKELSPKELAEAYLLQRRGEDKQTRGNTWYALSVWENLICEEPEKAWPVFLELLSQHNDDDTLEQISYRLKLLLANYWDDFHERVKTLVRNHEQLPRFLPDKAIAKEQFFPKEPTSDEIVKAYLENYRHSSGVRELEEIISSQPDRALTLVLEIIGRGQLHAFGSYELISPLWDLLKKQGELVIEGIEQAAITSVMLRRCLWRLKRQQEGTPDEYRINDYVWKRAEKAARNANDYNSDLPETVQLNRLTNEDEALIESWFDYEQTSWAFGKVWEITGNDPERLWMIVKDLVNEAPDEATLSYIGAGPLEDLLCGCGEQFIERIEQEVVTNKKFRFCLAGVWKSTIRDDLWDRITKALGNQDRY